MVKRAQIWAGRVAAGAAAFFAFTAAALPAGAQVVGPYQNNTAGTYNNVCPAGGPTLASPGNLRRTINVPDNFFVADVDVGIRLTHAYRLDSEVWLIAPSGTRARLLIGPAPNTPVANYNVRLDQDETVAVNTGVDANRGHSNTVAPFQYRLRPESPGTLDIFDGEAANGNWHIDFCDNFPGADNGAVNRTELFFTAAPPTADLALAMSASTTGPSYGSNVTMSLTVSHQSGSLTANGVTVNYQLPSGLSFQSASGSGTYNNTTGVWTVGTMAPGATRTINIVATVLSSGTHANVAEIATSSAFDFDSTPNNIATVPYEDDTARVTLAPSVAGGSGPSGEPLLSCPVPARFDWDINPWVYNATILSRTYPTGGSDGTPFTIAFSGDTGFRDTNSPATNANITGGLTPVQQSLYYFQNLTTTTQGVTITVDVGTPGVGVQDFQYRLFDIDFVPGQFADRITVQGSLNGVTAQAPIINTGSTNTATGTTITGTANADNATSDGNVIISFLTPVDRVVMTYSNTQASAGISNQAMSIHDFNYCPRTRDFGDIALTYGIASHLITNGYRIGAVAPDSETATLVSVDATGDDAVGVDDEDSINFSGLIVGQTSNLSVPVTGAGGFLQMWIDWNGDGDFSDTVDGVSERVATNVTIVGSSGTATVPVSVPLSAVLTPTKARLRWSTQSGLGVSGQANNGEVEDHQFTIGGAAVLQGSKTNAVYDPLLEGLYALPGNDMIYSIQVSNAGTGPTDANSVFLTDLLPPEVEFWNGDIDAGGPDTFPGTDPVGFVQADGAALTFTYASDIAFSTAATAPANFGECTAIAPDDTYRPDITYICVNPKGALASGDPDPNFTLSFRTRIK